MENKDYLNAIINFVPIILNFMYSWQKIKKSRYKLIIEIAFYFIVTLLFTIGFIYKSLNIYTLVFSLIVCGVNNIIIYVFSDFIWEANDFINDKEVQNISEFYHDNTKGIDYFKKDIQLFIITKKGTNKERSGLFGIDEADTIFTEKSSDEFNRQCENIARNLLQYYNNWIIQIYGIRREKNKLIIELKVKGQGKTLECVVKKNNESWFKRNKKYLVTISIVLLLVVVLCSLYFVYNNKHNKIHETNTEKLFKSINTTSSLNFDIDYIWNKISKIDFVDPQLEKLIKGFLEKNEINFSDISDIQNLLLIGNDIISINHRGYYRLSNDQFYEKCYINDNGTVTFDDLIIVAVDEGDFVLHDIKYFKGLDNLSLFYQKTVDTENISTLINLLGLHMIKCNIHDLDFIQNLINLHEINFSYNEIENIDAISYLNNLTAIDLSNNKIKSIESLRNLAYLNEVNIVNNQIEDYSPITKVEKITADKRKGEIKNLNNEKETGVTNAQNDIENQKEVSKKEEPIINEQGDSIGLLPETITIKVIDYLGQLLTNQTVRFYSEDRKIQFPFDFYTNDVGELNLTSDDLSNIEATYNCKYYIYKQFIDNLGEISHEFVGYVIFNSNYLITQDDVED